eukprot:PhF_6_TR40749/c0_g2_i4/m.61364
MRVRFSQMVLIWCCVLLSHHQIFAARGSGGSGSGPDPTGKLQQPNFEKISTCDLCRPYSLELASLHETVAHDFEDRTAYIISEAARNVCSNYRWIVRGVDEAEGSFIHIDKLLAPESDFREKATLQKEVDEAFAPPRSLLDQMNVFAEDNEDIVSKMFKKYPPEGGRVGGKVLTHQMVFSRLCAAPCYAKNKKMAPGANARKIMEAYDLDSVSLDDLDVNTIGLESTDDDEGEIEGTADNKNGSPKQGGLSATLYVKYVHLKQEHDDVDDENFVLEGSSAALLNESSVRELEMKVNQLRLERAAATSSNKNKDKNKFKSVVEVPSQNMVSFPFSEFNSAKATPHVIHGLTDVFLNNTDFDENSVKSYCTSSLMVTPVTRAFTATPQMQLRVYVNRYRRGSGIWYLGDKKSPKLYLIDLPMPELCYEVTRHLVIPHYFVSPDLLQSVADSKEHGWKDYKLNSPMLSILPEDSTPLTMEGGDDTTSITLFPRWIAHISGVVEYRLIPPSMRRRTYMFQVDAFNPDCKRHPLWCSPTTKVYSATATEGDVLYIPPGYTLQRMIRSDAILMSNVFVDVESVEIVAKRLEVVARRKRLANQLRKAAKQSKLKTATARDVPWIDAHNTSRLVIDKEMAILVQQQHYEEGKKKQKLASEATEKSSGGDDKSCNTKGEKKLRSSTGKDDNDANDANTDKNVEVQSDPFANGKGLENVDIGNLGDL